MHHASKEAQKIQADSEGHDSCRLGEICFISEPIAMVVQYLQKVRKGIQQPVFFSAPITLQSGVWSEADHTDASHTHTHTPDGSTAQGAKAHHYLSGGFNEVKSGAHECQVGCFV